MSTHRHPASHPRPTHGTRRSSGRQFALIGLILGLVACGAVLVLNPGKSVSEVNGTSPEKSAAAAAKSVPAPEKLVGRWLRPDGGYVLEIKRVGADGRIEATYANPRPIRISQAETNEQDGQRRLFVELRDEGYPGCTYKLKYVADTDQLEGIYFQAAIQEEFTVNFVRMP